MSSSEPPDDTDGHGDPWDRIRENRDNLEQVADRDDRLGALASIALSLANDERPDDEALEQMGVDAARRDGR